MASERSSETLTGVTQLKIGDVVCLFVYMYGTYVIFLRASEASETVLVIVTSGVLEHKWRASLIVR